MQDRFWPGLIVFSLVLAVGLPVAAVCSGTANETFVRVRPAGGTYDVGSTIDVEVVVEDVQNLYGADVQLTFDTTRLSVIDANPSEPGTQISPRDDLLSTDLVVREEANNTTGDIWYAVTQLNPSEPVTGTGTIFAFTLQTLSPGEAVPVAIESAKLATRSGDPITSTTQGAYYTIGAERRVFLPFVVKDA